MSTACRLAREDAGKEAGRRGEWAAESPALAHSSLLSAPGRRVLASRCGPGLQRRPRRGRADGTRSGCRPRAGGRGRADIVPHFQLWFTGRSAAAAPTREPSPPLHTLTSSPSSPSGLKKKKTQPAIFRSLLVLSHHRVKRSTTRRSEFRALQSAPRRGSPSTVTGVAETTFSDEDGNWRCGAVLPVQHQSRCAYTCDGDRVAPQPVCGYVKRCVASSAHLYGRLRSASGKGRHDRRSC